MKKKIVPVVITRHSGQMIKREARGFSMFEIKKAGLDFRNVLKHGLRIDRRRKSTIDENVKSLKSLTRKTRKSKAKSKR